MRDSDKEFWSVLGIFMLIGSVIVSIIAYFDLWGVILSVLFMVPIVSWLIWSVYYQVKKRWNN